jgi:hypothetical protein
VAARAGCNGEYRAVESAHITNWTLVTELDAVSILSGAWEQHQNNYIKGVLFISFNLLPRQLLGTDEIEYFLTPQKN